MDRYCNYIRYRESRTGFPIIASYPGKNVLIRLCILVCLITWKISDMLKVFIGFLQYSVVRLLDHVLCGPFVLCHMVYHTAVMLQPPWCHVILYTVMAFNIIS